jgi:hypothetical protein
VQPPDDAPDLRSAPGPTYRAADERAHRPRGDEWWESWQLDVAGDDGTGIAVVLARAPSLGVAWWWTHLLLPDRPGPVVVRDHEVPLPRVGLEVRADGLWGELVCETPFEHWTYGLEAFGVALDAATDSLRGEIGERVPVGFDLEWEIDAGGVGVRELDGPFPGYEQFGVVHGELLLARSRVTLDAVGRRAHRWGTPRWDRAARGGWLRERGATPLTGSDVPADASALGSFVVPLSTPAGRAVLTRTLLRSDSHGNGWSTTYEPE